MSYDTTHGADPPPQTGSCALPKLEVASLSVDPAAAAEATIRSNMAAYGLRLPVGTTFEADAAVFPGAWAPGLLERQAAIFVARGSKSAYWNRLETTLASFIGGLLHHRESAHKDGLIAFYGALGEVGRTTARRKGENVRALEALVCDIDGGASLLDILAAAMALGVCFVLFTSPSSTLEHPKARVVFFLAKALPIEALGDSLDERKLLLRVFRQHVLGTLEGFCDPCSFRLNQAHNLPRHRPGKHHVTIVRPGRGIVVPSLNELRELAAKAGLTRKRSGAVAGTRRTPVDFADPELRSLRREVGAFLTHHADRLDLVETLDVAGWEMFDGSETKRACRCPNDAEHSDPGNPNDRGCFVASAHDREDSFAVLHCAHAHCAQLGTADLLAMALHQLGLADPIGHLHDNLFEIL